jgi:hypothetical protein
LPRISSDVIHFSSDKTLFQVKREGRHDATIMQQNPRLSVGVWGGTALREMPVVRDIQSAWEKSG